MPLLPCAQASRFSASAAPRAPAAPASARQPRRHAARTCSQAGNPPGCGATASGVSLRVVSAFALLTPPASGADPFADEGDAPEEDANEGVVKGKSYVHVRVQQRNGRKSLTTVQARCPLARCRPHHALHTQPCTACAPAPGQQHRSQHMPPLASMPALARATLWLCASPTNPKPLLSAPTRRTAGRAPPAPASEAHGCRGARR